MKTRVNEDKDNMQNIMNFSMEKYSVEYQNEIKNIFSIINRYDHIMIEETHPIITTIKEYIQKI